MKQIQLAIFISGNGTNCENIIRYFAHSDKIQVKLVVASRDDCFGLQRAARLHVPSVVIPRQAFNDEPDYVREVLKDCDYLILAGFMLRIPDYLLALYPQRIINIHPSLLPKYGGKGMWGHHVHEAVYANHDKETGITIHYVSEELDAGQVIAQFHTTVTAEDTPETIEAKVHQLEQQHFPQTIEQVCLGE